MKSVIATIDNSLTEMNVALATLPIQNAKPEVRIGQNITTALRQSTILPFRIPIDCSDASTMITNTSTS